MDTFGSLYKTSTLSKKKLEQLIDAFQSLSNTPLLIYGPTGTGKSFHIKSIAVVLGIQLDYVMEPDKFNSKTLFKKHVTYIDTDDIRDLRNIPASNIVIESRRINSIGKNRNVVLIKFGKVSVMKLRKILKEHTEFTTRRKRLERDPCKGGEFESKQSFNDITDGSMILNTCCNESMVCTQITTPVPVNTPVSLVSHPRLDPNLSAFQGNMHLFPYVFSTANIFSFSHTSQITLFHYLGKIFYSKPSYNDHHYFDNKTVINFLFENYLLFYNYDDVFCDDLSLLYARKHYEPIIHMAYGIKNKRAGQFTSFKSPCQSPIHLHHENEYEDLS
ncbi:hypothetical protein VCUG_00991 [Vavraia culicis subsp. floridensis]|uniref:Uncharacterized protein n=1 Tax=Vavraia culicis (isolate floridensis) TaxID=948595 RepID=L2GWU1_VAVCU|nr:uncharacterized protein VCUG_00991 [Vavraia culicis subsp. floridensis]ELA47560.1 hypothetical protein VCUG_00991 [Vavraia culicis subsp. floridensis]